MVVEDRMEDIIAIAFMAAYLDFSLSPVKLNTYFLVDLLVPFLAEKDEEIKFLVIVAKDSFIHRVMAAIVM